MARLPSNLKAQIATARQNILYPTYGGSRLNPRDETLISRGGGGWSAYDIYTDLARDPHAGAVLQKRYQAVTGREWYVEPASKSKKDQKVADFVEDCLKSLGSVADQQEDGEPLLSIGSGFDGLCHGLLSAILYGFQPAEIIWDDSGKEIRPIEAQIKDLRRFAFIQGDLGFKMRLLTWANPHEGEPLPLRKFICHRYTAQPVEDPYGLGIGSRLFYPVFFKRNAVKFWLIFADKWASPTAIGKHPRNASEDQRAALLEALESIATDSGVVIPEDQAIEFLEAARSSSVDTYQGLVDFCNSEMSKTTLGETGSTDQSGSGGSRARDQVGNEIRIETAKADADQLSETLNRSLIRWIVFLNYGPNVTPPTVWRRFPELEEKFDRAGEAGIVATLTTAGFKPTREWVAEKFEIDLEEEQQQGGELAGLFGSDAGAEPPTGDQPPEEQPTEEAPIEEPPAEPPPEDTPTLSESDNQTVSFEDSPDRDIADDYTDRANRETSIEPWLKAIKGLLSSSDSLEDARGKLFDLLPSMDAGNFAETLGLSIAAAELAGRYEVIQEGSEEFQEALAVLEELQALDDGSIEFAEPSIEELQTILENLDEQV